MRFTILEKIKSETRLARLFNTYMEGLSTLEIFSTPRESMRECRVAFAKKLFELILQDGYLRYFDPKAI